MDCRKKCGVGQPFTFEGWKKCHQGDQAAPKATTIGGQVVYWLEAEPSDPRLDFIGLTTGPGKAKIENDKKGNNAQYYVRLK